MDFFGPLLGAFQSLAVPSVLLVIFLGVVAGSVAGALPGFNTSLAIGIAIPFTFVIGPVEAVGFLIALAVGSQYGNSIPAILVGIPGNAAAVLTVVEGHTLHKRGETGLALGVNYYAAVVGQFVSGLLFIALVVPLSRLGYHFHAPELFAVTLLGVTALLSLTGKNVVKGLVAAAIGYGLTLVGPDPMSGFSRFDFGVPELRGGLHVIPVTLGLLAVSEIIRASRQAHDWGALTENFSARFPKWATLRPATKMVLGGTVVGTGVGAIPGMSGIAAAAISYQQSKAFAEHPEDYGKGSVEGIAANEAAQNASNAGELVPTLGLGIPGSDSMVLLLSALTLQGLIPGPAMFRETPEMLDAGVAGLLGGTIVLAITGWGVARLLVRVVNFDRRLVLTGALAAVVVGTYSIRTSIFDLIVLLLCGLLGYFMMRYGYSVAAAAIAVVLGGIAEGYLRRGLNLAGNDWVTFLTRPITAVVLLLALAILVFGIRRSLREYRDSRASEKQVSS